MSTTVQTNTTNGKLVTWTSANRLGEKIFVVTKSLIHMMLTDNISFKHFLSAAEIFFCSFLGGFVIQFFKRLLLIWQWHFAGDYWCHFHLVASPSPLPASHTITCCHRASRQPRWQVRHPLPLIHLSLEAPVSPRSSGSCSVLFFLVSFQDLCDDRRMKIHISWSFRALRSHFKFKFFVVS